MRKFNIIVLNAGFAVFLSSCNPPPPGNNMTMYAYPMVSFSCAYEKTVYYNDGDDTSEISVRVNYPCGSSTRLASVKIYRADAKPDDEPLKVNKLSSPKDSISVKVPPGMKVTLLCPGSSDDSRKCDYTLSVPGISAPYWDSASCFSGKTITLPKGKDTTGFTIQFSDICGKLTIETYNLVDVDTMPKRINEKKYEHDDLDMGPAPAIRFRVKSNTEYETYITISCGRSSVNKMCKLNILKQ